MTTDNNTPRAARPCLDPFNDRDGWVLWLMLDQPLERLCHVLMSGILAMSYRGPHGGPGLVWEAGEFWCYNPKSGAWSVLPRFRVEQRLNMWSGHRVGDGERVRVITLAKHVKISILSCLEIECTPPRPVFDNARKGIAFRNGFLGMDFQLEANDPENFAQWSLDCDYHPYSELMEAGRYDGSLFSRFWALSEVGSDEINLIGQHMFSALSGTACQYGRALLLLGPRGTGKSQVLNMYEHLVPPGAVCNVTPQQLEGECYGAELKGKALNICYELSSVNPIPDEAGLKAIVQGERITRRPIRQAPVTFQPVAANVFASNGHIPIVAPSSAFYDRWALVGFNHTMRGTAQAITNVGKRIAAEELNLLIAWVVHCGQQLTRVGRYTLPESHWTLVAEWKNQGDSVAAWIEEDTRVMTQEPAASWMTITEAFDRFIGWARAGQYTLVNRAEFKRRLESYGYKTTRSNGTRVPLARAKQ